MSLYVDIEKDLGSFKLKVKFEQENGILGLLGQSGCGKSMTLKCIAGIVKPDKGKIISNGTVFFDSEKKINLSPQKRKVGFLFQNYALFPHMSVKENIQLGIQNLSKEENKSLGYISMSSDLYKLLLFEDMLRIDYSDKCTVKIDLDVEYVGKWWSENILPIFKERYSKKDLIDKLELEIKKNEIVDFHGKNFEKLKNEIINEIEKEYENEKELNEDFESEEKVSLESELKTKKSKSISDLQELIEKTDIKYENNIETLRDYCSDEFIDILENSNDENYSLKDLEQFLEDNKEYFNDKAYIFFEVCVQKQIQKLEQDLLNDICEVKTLKDLKELHDKLLENGEFVKCEDLETIIFRKMETIVKILNLAEINDEENISIANQMYENTSSIELEKYPIAEILICRDINIDLNNVKETIEDLREEVNEIKDTVLKNCMFNCEYYNMNIQINDSENYYTIKFRYIKDLIDYIKLKEGNRLLINLKNIKKTSQYKRRVFNKGNSEIIKEIDNFYSA